MNDPQHALAQATAPSLDDFAALASEALRALPQPFRRMAKDIVCRVQDFAEDEVLADLGIDDAFDLTGLYQGHDIRHRSPLHLEADVSQVFLYRRPILDEWAERGDVTLSALITHVLVHELGHHFGLSDADIDAIEAR
jgi:predicted Zn-dependent protease with MMP-like domain